MDAHVYPAGSMREPRRVHRVKLAWGFRMQIFERDKFTCRCCGYQGVGLFKTRLLAVDHVIPLSAGGRSIASNLQTLCADCNAIKGVRVPNRMIRESARTSETLDQLSDGAERMFWRLTTVADDFGRFEADPRVLLSACFPLRAGRLKIEQIEKWMKELILVELVDTYKVETKKYGVFKTWDKHQRVRAQHSKYPAPSSDNICPRLTADVPVVEVLPRVEETEGERRTNGASPPTRPQTPADDRIEFQIPDHIKAALERCPRLAAVPRLLNPRWWQAQVRANRGVDFAQAVLGAEAWLVTNSHKPKKDLVRFLHNWLAEEYRRLHA